MVKASVMKLLLFLLFIYSFSLSAVELQSGDIILISFNCYECRVIEAETNSTFSHSGVILLNANHEIFVAQSLINVRLSPLQDFLNNKTPGTKAFIYRPFEFDRRTDWPELAKNMHDVFIEKFLGLPFDEKYSWNNFDNQGRELLYCSEFVAKFLDHFLTSSTVLAPLTYDKNHAFWFQYFHGQIPEGEMGNSPAALSRDPRFHFIGNLD